MMRVQTCNLKLRQSALRAPIPQRGSLCRVGTCLGTGSCLDTCNGIEWAKVCLPLQRGGGGFVPSQTRGNNFAVGNFAETPGCCVVNFADSQKCCGVNGFAGSVKLSHRCHLQWRRDPDEGQIGLRS